MSPAVLLAICVEAIDGPRCRTVVSFESLVVALLDRQTDVQNGLHSPRDEIFPDGSSPSLAIQSVDTGKRRESIAGARGGRVDAASAALRIACGGSSAHEVV